MGWGGRGTHRWEAHPTFSSDFPDPRGRVEELQVALLEAEAHIEDGSASAALEAELGVELEAVRAKAAAAQVCWSCVHEVLALA